MALFQGIIAKARATPDFRFSMFRDRRRAVDPKCALAPIVVPGAPLCLQPPVPVG